MVQRVMVPIDGSAASWGALDVAIALARRCAAPVDVVEVVFDERDLVVAEGLVAGRLRRLDTDGVELESQVRLGTDTVAAALAEVVDAHPDTTVVMSSHGRGRSAALVGSVTDDLLACDVGPIVVVGPAVQTAHFGGPLLVTVDGSELSELALPLAAAWAAELGVEPWIVEVNVPDQVTSEHLVESSYPARLARRLTAASGRQTQFEVLHGSDPADAVADFAASLGASLVVSTTHGRTGMSRLRLGSTAAAFVRKAPCPVLLVRPPRVASGDDAVASTASDR